MDYIQISFGKTLDELTYQDVEDFFIEEKEESIRLEFKSYSDKDKDSNKLDGIIRGLCALLNSEGGILIWGAPEGQAVKGKKEKIFKGALSPVPKPKQIEKDQLINKISDTISPLPTGVSVKILTQDSDKFVYVFEVQTSNYRPHQYKHIYYARLDGQTKPAPHYLVEALMKRVTYPNIEGYLKIVKWFSQGDSHIIDIQVIICNFSELQNEENVLLDTTVGPGVFHNWSYKQPYRRYIQNGHRLRDTDFAKIIHYGVPVICSERIIIDDDELWKCDQKINIIILFGGKYSPMKSSEYVLDISKGAPNLDYNNLIDSKEENIIMADGQRKRGSGKEDFLKFYLER